MDRISSAQTPWAIDEWTFLIIFAWYTFGYHNDPPVVATLFAILVLYFLAGRFLPERWQYLTKFSILALLIGIFVVGFSVVEIYLRHTTAPYLHVHDGLIQTEEATKLLLAGRNPYGADYSQTPMAKWDFRVGDSTVNPALWHNPYLPFFFVFSVPFYVVSSLTLGWFDGRMIYLPMFLVALFILAQWVKERSRRFALLWFVAFNPFFLSYFIQGRNDIFVLFWILLAVHSLRHRHEGLALVSLGLACASKLTTWFLIPFFVIYLLQPPQCALGSWLRSHLISSFKRIVPLIGTIVIVLLPFFLWQPTAFVDDIWNFMNGTSAQAPYPLSGYSFSVIAQGLGLIPQDASRSSFEILQWVVGLPLFVFLVRRQIKHNSLHQMWYSYAFLLAVMAFFSHVLNDSHIGFILTLFAIAAFTDEMELTRAEIELA